MAQYLRDEPKKRNNLKIFDIYKSIFKLHAQRSGQRYFSLHVKARIYHERWRILLSGMFHATYICGLTGFVVPEILVLYL